MVLNEHAEAIINVKFSQKSSKSRIKDLESQIKTLQRNLIQKPGLFQTVCNDAQQLGLFEN